MICGVPVAGNFLLQYFRRSKSVFFELASMHERGFSLNTPLYMYEGKDVSALM